MKALSLRQPWAFLYCTHKDVENRTWPTKIRGRVLIHASYSKDDMTDDVIHNAMSRLNAHELLYFTRHFDHRQVAFGALIGEVDIIDCVTESDSPWFDGPPYYGFVRANPVLYTKPIPYKGRLGFFDVPDEIVRAARGINREDTEIKQDKGYMRRVIDVFESLPYKKRDTCPFGCGELTDTGIDINGNRAEYCPRCTRTFSRKETKRGD